MARNSLSLLVLGAAVLMVLANAQAQFCWRDSYGRGVGTIPSECGNRDKIGLFCYDKCPTGYTRFGFDCHQSCLSGWRDDGLFCRLAEYGRGAGYPWQFGDPLNSDGQWARCNRDNPDYGCELNGLIVYPKCKPGFSAFGCCICRPNVPNCGSLGYATPGLDLSCPKNIIIGAPFIAGCNSGSELNAGLCYVICKSGYDGVGPVCWSRAPSNWVLCGMGAAKSSLTCASTIASQVTSVVSVIVNIATLGAASAGTKAVGTGSSASSGILAKVQPLLDKAKDLYNTVDKTVQPVKELFTTIGKAASKASTVATVTSTILNPSSLKTDAEAIQFAAQIASLVDPTGIASVVAAYSYPLCSALFK